LHGPYRLLQLSSFLQTLKGNEIVVIVMPVAALVEGDASSRTATATTTTTATATHLPHDDLQLILVHGPCIHVSPSFSMRRKRGARCNDGPGRRRRQRISRVQRRRELQRRRRRRKCCCRLLAVFRVLLLMLWRRLLLLHGVMFFNRMHSLHQAVKARAVVGTSTCLLSA
jgi:hypothetical protein